ncbi:MAG TPA: dicarboxylate/amino acid:cation symporter, partial [Erysipelotrichaceae bacterium]|nr:dicarboxylate/amino acid:cation symporter [Erysipelotrichaceae bacterium]
MTFTVLDFVAAAVALVMFAVLFFLDKKKNLDFSLLILIGTAFGILLGVLFTTHYNIVAMVGTIYSQALSAFVVPL